MHSRSSARVAVLLWLLAPFCLYAQSELTEETAAPLAELSATQTSRASGRFQLPDTFDLNGMFFQIVLQLTPAKVTDTFPVSPFTDRLGSAAFPQKLYRMNVCKRADVADCMPSGAWPSPRAAQQDPCWVSLKKK